MPNKIENESPNEKFKRIATSRTQKIIDMLRLLGNCSNTYVYEYNKEDVDKIFSAIDEEVKAAKAKFGNSSKKKDKFTL